MAHLDLRQHLCLFSAWDLKDLQVRMPRERTSEILCSCYGLKVPLQGSGPERWTPVVTTEKGNASGSGHPPKPKKSHQQISPWTTTSCQDWGQDTRWQGSLVSPLWIQLIYSLCIYAIFLISLQIFQKFKSPKTAIVFFLSKPPVRNFKWDSFVLDNRRKCESFTPPNKRHGHNNHTIQLNGVFQAAATGDWIYPH